MKRLLILLIAISIAAIACGQEVLKRDLELRKTAPVLNLNGSGASFRFYNGDVSLTHSTNLLTLSGGNLSLGANSLLGSGSIGATGARLLKGWFTDLEITNLPTVNGVAFKTALALTASDVGLGNVTNESKSTILNNSALTGTTTVATTINPDANDGATLGQSGVGWSDLFIAENARITWGADAAIFENLTNNVILSQASLTLQESLFLGSPIVLQDPDPDVTLSQTELAALDGVTGSINYSTENYGATGTGDIVLSTGATMTTVNITDVIKLTPTASPPSGATEGMIYADTDHHLYYYNGTSWVSMTD